MTRTIFFIIVLLLILGIEVYTYHGLKAPFHKEEKEVIAHIIDAMSIVVIVAGIVSYGLVICRQEMLVWAIGHNVLIGIMFTLVITKIVFVRSLFLGDSFRICQILYPKN